MISLQLKGVKKFLGPGERGRRFQDWEGVEIKLGSLFCFFFLGGGGIFVPGVSNPCHESLNLVEIKSISQEKK